MPDTSEFLAGDELTDPNGWPKTHIWQALNA